MVFSNWKEGNHLLFPPIESKGIGVTTYPDREVMGTLVWGVHVGSEGRAGAHGLFRAWHHNAHAASLTWCFLLRYLDVDNHYYHIFFF